LKNFNEFGLSPAVLKAVSALGFQIPTPIQEKAIPLILEGRDLMGLAQTGTGKTAAFGLPLVHHLNNDHKKPAQKYVHALILAPTRELATQIAENLRSYVKNTPLRVGLAIGGQSINMQRNRLQRGTDILVATPGRLLDLVDRKAVILDAVKHLVLDEADQMLDLGFIHPLRKIAKLVNYSRQTMLFSATMPKQVEELSRAFLKDPVRVETVPPGRAADKISQTVHHVHSRAKTEMLKNCLIERQDDLSLVFARTKHGAEKLKKHLDECGFKVGSIHGNKSQGQRDRAIKAFKNREIRILVATDIAARGIDIPGITHVYNYNLPEVPENYVHRIGRTARAGSEGIAIAFCAPEEANLLRAIEKLMGVSITVASGEVPEYTRGKQSSRPNNRSHKPGNRSKRPNRNRGGVRQDNQPDGQFKKRRRSKRKSVAA